MITGVGSPGGKCVDCPMNKWGSAINGNGKACKERRTLFLLTEHSNMPIRLSVPPGSLGAVKKVLVRAAFSGVKPSQALWSFKLEKVTKAKEYSQIVLNFVRRLDEEEVALTQEFTKVIGGISGGAE